VFVGPGAVVGERFFYCVQLNLKKYASIITLRRKETEVVRVLLLACDYSLLISKGYG